MSHLPIRPAGVCDEAAVARLIADSFHDLGINRWLVPDPVERREIFPGYFRLAVGHALRHGSVDIAGAMAGVLVTVPVPGPGIPDYDARLSQLCGRWAGRFRQFEALLAQAHSSVRQGHELVQFVAVDAGQRREGIFTTLMRLRLEDLDRQGRPSYCELVSEDMAAFCRARLGFVTRQTLVLPQDAGSLHIVWRPPAPI